jgi:hypothetical protein
MSSLEQMPTEQFLHDARVLPQFDLGDELQSLRAAYGEEVAQEAEVQYWAQKEAK